MSDFINGFAPKSGSILVSQFSHHSGFGVHTLIRFPNDYGASITPCDCVWQLCNRITGYYELAVIKFDSASRNRIVCTKYGSNYKLIYDTDVTQDVEQHLDINEVQELLYKIELL